MPKPSFDTWTIIFLFAGIQGLFVALVLFFVRKENRFNNNLLALLIFLFSVTLIEYVLYWTHYIQWFPHMMNVSAPFPFLFGVLLYYYFNHIFEAPKKNKVNLLHLLPFLIYFLFLLPYYLSTASTKQEWLHGNMMAPSLFHWPGISFKMNRIFPWLMIVHMSFYAFVIYRRVHPLTLTNHEVRNWFNWLFTLFLFFIISFSSYYILVQFPFFNRIWDYMISFAMMFFIYFIAWFGYLQPRVFSGFTLNESLTKLAPYMDSLLDNDTSKEILQKLETAMRTDKLYRDNDLRLDKLAGILGVSKHHLSQVINQQTGMNFFEYINHHRIEEAKQLLSATSKKELNIIEIAYEVGFNNKVSFNTAFKKITGKTPTNFRNENLFELKDQKIS